VQKAPEATDDLVAQLNDPGFEFTSRPQRIAHFTAFLNRVGTLKTKVGGWKELFWRPHITKPAIERLARRSIFRLQDSRSTNSWRNPMPERIVAVKLCAF
jgi:hypothetical protein